MFVDCIICDGNQNVTAISIVIASNEITFLITCSALVRITFYELHFARANRCARVWILFFFHLHLLFDFESTFDKKTTTVPIGYV